VNSSMIASRQHPNRPSIGGTVGYEVVTPYVVTTIRTQPNAPAVVQPEPLSFRQLFSHFESLLTPDPLHPLVVHSPSLPI